MSLDRTGKETTKDRWRAFWPVMLGSTAYMLPLFWLWEKVDYPQSFGFHITAHGKAGLLENWWYSYLLIERHSMWDVVTFLYMWASVTGFVIWAAMLLWRERQSKVADLKIGDATSQKDDTR